MGVLPGSPIHLPVIRSRKIISKMGHSGVSWAEELEVWRRMLSRSICQLLDQTVPANSQTCLLLLWRQMQPNTHSLWYCRFRQMSWNIGQKGNDHQLILLDSRGNGHTPHCKGKGWCPMPCRTDTLAMNGWDAASTVGLHLQSVDRRYRRGTSTFDGGGGGYQRHDTRKIYVT